MGSFTHDDNASPLANTIGNELDSALSAMSDEFREYRADFDNFSDDEIETHVRAMKALDDVLDSWIWIQNFLI